MKFLFKKILLNVIVAMTCVKSAVNAGSSLSSMNRKTFSNHSQLLPFVSKMTHRQLQEVSHPIARLKSSKCLDDFLMKNSSKRYERCGDYLLSKLVTMCLPKWSLDKDSLCTQIEKSPFASKCAEGLVDLGKTCVKDQVKIRETICDKNFKLINNRTCERRYHFKPVPSCEKGYIFSHTTLLCEKWQTDNSTVARSPQISSIGNLTIQRIIPPFLTCDSNSRSIGESCATFSYTKPHYKCPSGLALDNTDCIKIKERCVSKNTFPQLCVHSIPPEKKKTASITRQNCFKNTKDKWTFCCPKAYELYQSDYDVRCIYTSSFSQCLAKMDTFYSSATFCMEEPIPATPFCQQGKYHDQLQLCEITKMEQPIISCPKTFQYHNLLKECVETTDVISQECDGETEKCTKARNTSDFGPVQPINTARLLLQKQVDQKEAIWTCPPNSTLIKDFQNIHNTHAFLCEKVEQHLATFQCPEQFHEGIENLCVRQIFSPLSSFCPIGFQHVNEECVKILKSAPVTFCSQGFTLSTFLPLYSNETEGKLQRVCVMQLS